MSKRRIYLDHAAGTPVAPEVAKAMEGCIKDVFGNPSSIHREGVSAKTALKDAREKVAKVLSVKADEIVFTGSGSESINLAILGTVRASKIKNPHIITTAIEHKAVLETAHTLEKEGVSITYLPVDINGLVKVADVLRAVKPETVLVSIMYANNEIGTVEPIIKIGSILKEKFPNVYFHTDACQAGGMLPLSVERMRVDLLTLNGSKIYGPKGVGALFVRRGTKIEPIIYGGGQEHKLRAGTENVVGIVGFALALELAEKLRKKESKRLTLLRDYLIKRILTEIPDTELNGHPKERLPGNVNISFKGIPGEKLVLYLDAKGVAVGTGSACETANPKPSHVILALGKSKESALSTIRFSLGRSTTKKDLDYVMSILPGIVEKLRKAPM